MSERLMIGDCLDVLRTFEAESIDACVTDPPYDLTSGKRGGSGDASMNTNSPAGRSRIGTGGGFMGLKWDATGIAFRPDFWREVLRVLKPGAYVLACGGTRTYHRMAVAIEDAGFEIRDVVAWLHSTGFPKSLNVSEALSDGLDPCRCALLRMRQNENDAAGVGKAGEVSEVLLPMQWPREGPGLEAARSQGPGRLDGGIGTFLPSEDERGEQSGMEGRRYVQAEQGELHRPEICAVPVRVVGDGSEGRLRHGTSAGDGAVDRATADAHGSRASRGPRHAPERAGKSVAVADESKPQARGAWATCQRCGKPMVPQGLGTALKPAFEPVVMARKPFRGSVKGNVEKHGTGALNIDATRIGTGGQLKWDQPRDMGYHGGTDNGPCDATTNHLGRWPANVCLDELAAMVLDEMSGDCPGATSNSTGRAGDVMRLGLKATDTEPGYADSGGASRFFMVCSPDCVLCSRSIVNRDTMSGWKVTSANDAERRSKTIHQIIAATALSNAHGSRVEQLVQAAPSVESLCERCVISIALALVEIKSSGSKQAALTVFRDSIPSYKSSTLIRSLASFAELWGNIDTIPTTTSLSLLFGSVLHAIENCTRPASLESVSDQPRFLYSAKPSREERDFGCESLRQRTAGEATARTDGTAGLNNPRAGAGRTGGARNFHPTVKPVELMRWLIRLVTPVGGVVLDPFLGSGTTGMAARYEQRDFIGIEREAEYMDIARRRINAVAPLFADAVSQ